MRKNVPTHFRTEAANACYIQNIIYLRAILKNTSYELWKGRKSNISYFHQFGCNEFLFSNHKCMCFEDILNDLEYKEYITKKP